VPKYRRAVRQAVPKARQMLRAQASSAATALRVMRSPSGLVTYFLPPVWGAVAMRRLRQHAYL
jgi:hypothetical protein